MKEDRVTNKICIRLCDTEGNYKASYYTSNMHDSLAMYKYMSEEDMPKMNKKLKLILKIFLLTLVLMITYLV